MADNMLTGGVSGPQYPTYQPQQPVNPLAMAQQATQLAQGQQNLQLSQQQLGMQRLNYLHDQMGSIAALKNPTFQDVTDVAANLTRMGYPQDQISSELAKFSGLSSQEIKAKALQHMAGIADHSQRLGLGYDVPVQQEKGGATLYGTRSVTQPGLVSLPGATQSGAGTTLPAAADPTDLVDGPPIRSETGAVSQPRLPKNIAVGIANGSLKYTTGSNGQMIIVKAGGSAPAPNAATPPAQPTAMGIPGVPAGATEAAGVTAQGSATQANSLSAAAGGAPVRRGMLNNLEDDLGKFSSGPMAQATLAAKRLYNQGADAVGMPKIDEAGVAAHENFNKQATQLAQQQFSALGGTGTDQQLGSAFKANPNDALSNMGNKQIIQMLKGNEDAIAAKNTAWQDWQKKNGSDTFGQFQEFWNKNYSPRAFQWAHMSQDERKNMVSKFATKQERDQFAKSLDIAEQNGWLKPGQ